MNVISYNTRDTVIDVHSDIWVITGVEHISSDITKYTVVALKTTDNTKFISTLLDADIVRKL